VKEIWKSVNIWGSFGQEFSVLFFLTHGVEAKVMQTVLKTTKPALEAWSSCRVSMLPPNVKQMALSLSCHMHYGWSLNLFHASVYHKLVGVLLIYKQITYWKTRLSWLSLATHCPVHFCSYVSNYPIALVVSWLALAPGPNLKTSNKTLFYCRKSVMHMRNHGYAIRYRHDMGIQSWQLHSPSTSSNK